MLKNLQYYYRLAMYKLSLEGEDNDSSYEAQIPFHNGIEKQYFDINNLPDGYPTITNVKLSPRQKKLRDLELERLASLKAKAKEERTKYHEEFEEKRATNQIKKKERKERRLAQRNSQEPKKRWSFFRRKPIET